VQRPWLWAVWGARAAGRGIERVYFAKMHEYKPSNDGAS